MYFFNRPTVMTMCLVILALFVTVSDAAAQQGQRPIETNLGEPWLHQGTGITMPAKLGGFDRKYVRDLTAKELDVFAQYYDDESQTRITFFVYRAAINSVPLWFDAANQALRANTGLLASTNAFNASTFTPPSQSSPSGMVATYQASGGPIKSSGIAMFPLNGWLVKLRFSSAEISVEEMATSIGPIFDEIGWPDSVRSGPTAVAIEPCKNTLKLSDKVKRFKPSLNDALLGSLVGAASADDALASQNEMVVYCRDPQNYGKFAVYRANGSKDGYVLPLGDAGRALSIQRNKVGGAISGTSGRRYTPLNMQLDRNIVYTDLNKLPTPRLLMSAASDNAAISSTTTWPKGEPTITIGTPTKEDE